MLGPVVGLHLEVIAHLAVAWAGAYVLVRVLGLNRLAAVGCASIFAGGSWYYLHIAAGHAWLLPYAYLPWLAALLWMSVERRRCTFAALGGLLMALIFAEGGVYLLSHAVLMLGLLASMIAIKRRTSFPLWAFFAMGGFTIGFAAVKLLPTLQLISSRFTDPFEFNHPSILFQALFSPDQDLYRTLTGGIRGFYEYGAYIGPFVSVLFLIGACFRPRPSCGRGPDAVGARPTAGRRGPRS